MNPRKVCIVEFAVLASRPELRDALALVVDRARLEGLVLRSELVECSLQAYLFAGFPSALEALQALRRRWPAESEQVPEEELRDTALLYPKYLELGEKLYAQVYAGNAPTVREGLLKLHPDLAIWAVTEGYGKTLSRPGLDIVTRELAIVGMLTQLGWDRQLYSHILGSKNVGANIEEIESAIVIGARGNLEKEQLGFGVLKRLSSKG